jgi:DNA-binding CsgD family transcriptional regulator
MRLPAGIESGIEIYRNKEGELDAMICGTKMHYLDLPIIIREIFQSELIADKQAINSLTKEMKVTEADQMELKFVDCRYGRYNYKPDLDGHSLHPDAPSCSELKTCPGFGKVCKIPKGKNGILSRQEYIITLLVAKGKQDKEISFELDIEISTIRTYLARIREKLCVNNRIEIALWAINNGVI